MKKLLSYLLVIALVLVQFMPLVSAAETDDVVDKGSIQAGTKGTINITNTLEGKTYTIYQVLELESYDDTAKAYTYNAAEGWEKFLNSAAVKNVYLSYNETTGVWTWVNGADAQKFAQLALAYAKENGVEIAGQETSNTENGTITFANLELGYYLVDSTAGALCNLTTTHAVTTIKEKNAVPSVDKVVKEDSSNSYGDSNTADFFQVVEFKTTIDVQTGAENYVLIDVMSEGLTLNTESFKITVKGQKVPSTKYDLYTLDNTSASNLTVNYNGEKAKATFILKFKNEYTATLTAEDDIVVEYTATLNEKAVVELEGNKNETWLEYGDNNDSNKDVTRTYTLSFDVEKTDANGDTLTGAEFELYTAQTGGQKIALVKISEGVYRIASAEEQASENFKSAVLVAGKFMIQGLDADTYYLEEIKAPEGYNKLSSRIQVVVGTTMSNTTINATVTGNYNSQIVTYANDDVTVKNFTGSLLPSTGGMGTVLFITVGSIMVLGFGVLLVTKLRLSKMDI